MSKKREILFGTFLYLCSFSLNSIFAEAPATFDGGQIEEAEILGEGAIALYEFKLQEEGLKRQLLYGILKRKLVGLEMKATGKKPVQLLHEFIDTNYDSTLSGNIKKYFNNDFIKSENSNNPEYESRHDDEDDEGRQIKFEVENRYMASLIKKYNVKFHFINPEPPQFSINIANQPYWGKSDAKVTVVEFSDFECPYCKKMQSDIQKIKMKYGGKIKWVFIDFPLEFHKNAMLAHIGAHCAAEQSAHHQANNPKNMYFELQQLLFQSAPELDKKTILELAQSIQLNIDNFQTCLNDKEGKKKNLIEENTEYGKKLGIGGTPTLFINGKYHPGLLQYKELEDIIEKEL